MMEGDEERFFLRVVPTQEASGTDAIVGGYRSRAHLRRLEHQTVLCRAPSPLVGIRRRAKKCAHLRSHWGHSRTSEMGTKGGVAYEMDRGRKASMGADRVREVPPLMSQSKSMRMDFVQVRARASRRRAACARRGAEPQARKLESGVRCQIADLAHTPGVRSPFRGPTRTQRYIVRESGSDSVRGRLGVRTDNVAASVQSLRRAVSVHAAPIDDRHPVGQDGGTGREDESRALGNRNIPAPQGATWPGEWV
ncbi:hypothetical protein B0H16DRAFT_1715359 [Mycena metata]|uniref:Uncharacterized protein n=1 Tax=Mycena metata TaxID=1033252 RepID=A0AAD7NQT1_9AGAR|nr:hypothetical protein B0H16DRAFT_1715359 [Mycena metata]